MDLAVRKSVRKGSRAALACQVMGTHALTLDTVRDVIESIDASLSLSEEPGSTFLRRCAWGLSRSPTPPRRRRPPTWWTWPSPPPDTAPVLGVRAACRGAQRAERHRVRGRDERRRPGLRRRGRRRVAGSAQRCTADGPRADDGHRLGRPSRPRSSVWGGFLASRSSAAVRAWRNEPLRPSRMRAWPSRC